MPPRRPPMLEESSEDRWMVSYADFVTLLFAFFVVMYAVARSNQVEFSELSQTLDAAFSRPARSMKPIQIGQPVLAESPHVVDISEDPGYADPEPGDTRIEPTAERVLEHFSGLDGIEVPRVAADHDWLEISLPSEVLFAAGSTRMRPEAERVLREVAAFLGAFDNPVTIEGYTDNMPMSSAQFPSNWELSAFRASAVARYLESRGIARERLSAVGYGENHPLETNATPEGRARNRRVDIIVARDGNLGRNRNAANQGSAFAHVRRGEPDVLDESINRVRTDEGWLFTNEAQPDGRSPDEP